MRTAVILLGVLAGCTASIGDNPGGGGDAAIDAASPDDTGATDGVVPLGPWQPPVVVPITPMSDDDPTLTSDLLELYFNRNQDIYVATRGSIADAWGLPALVLELSSLDRETTPEISYDGLTMYLSSPRAGTLGGNDIWMSKRATRADLWSAPVHVPELSSIADDGASAPAGELAIVLDTARAGTLDIFVATRATAGDAWGAPVAVAEVNGVASDSNPMLSADRLELYFNSDRTGDNELYVATRASTADAFGAPVPITELNSTSNESDPWISTDRRSLYFTSSRDGTTRLWHSSR